MSSIMVIQNKNTILMGVDSALSCNLDGITYRVNKDEKKIKVIGNKIFVCFGMKKVTDRILDFCESLALLESNKEDERDKSINRISKICNEVCKQFNNDKAFKKNNNIRILIITVDHGTPILTTLDSFLDFEPDRFWSLGNDYVLTTDGMKKKEMADSAIQYFNECPNLIDVFRQSYNENSCEAIGGKGVVMGFIDGKFTEHEFDIKEREDLKRIDLEIDLGEFIYE